MNTIQVENLARSAIAPLISATVMMANTAWKATNARAGIMSPLAPKAASPRSPESPKCWNGLPTRPCQELPNASLYPQKIQTTLIDAIAPKLIIIMFRTLLALTMPP